ncbi:MAG: hypothetical protein BA861_07005 [Desulfobacterales bacterium S3730MH5]|nr:MAG: hypothetical protein BA861_07005 [Desulfobacterales bacterium S3730MH5]
MQQITDRIREDWGDSPQSRICLTILDYIRTYPGGRLSHITPGSLHRLFGGEYDDPHILGAAQYLCGDRVRILDIRFELIDTDDQTFVLDNEDIREAEETGCLIHPETGDPVKNFKNKVFIFFEPSTAAKQIFW